MSDNDWWFRLFEIHDEPVEEASVDDLNWLYQWYEYTRDWDFRHYHIPMWIPSIGTWSVQVIDVRRGLQVQLPLFTIL